ncbi:MAG TPA: OpgC domain-containing protein [Acetobacteraceae bacterium]|nr:OpgC domain-containing protein [Acetobacteraceae bacterium]
MTLIRSNRSRDLRVDFFRGLALWWIYTDHIPGDILGKYSLQNFALCDAAEVFVLLAGFGAGIAYGTTMNRQGYLYAAADTLRRAWTLYIAHIFLFVVYAAQVAYSAAALDRMFYLEEARLNVLADDPFRALLEALLLRFQPNLLNILPLYVTLLLMFALALPLLRWPKLLFLVSGAIYVAVRMTGFNLPSWDDAGGWFLNPLAWQFLFMIGAILAYAPPRMPRVRWPLDTMAAAILVAGVVIIWVIDNHPRILASMPMPVIRFLITQDKTGLHPFRLISILSLTWVVVRIIPREASWLQSRYSWPLVLMGQNSLPVFCCGIFFGFMARLGLETDDSTAMQFVVNVFGVLAMLAVAGLAAWYRGKGRGSAVPRQTVSLPAVARTDTG